MSDQDSAGALAEFCIFPNCLRTYKRHKWGVIKAHNEGWFFQKNGDVYCPEHVPEWVAKWRARHPKFGVTQGDNGRRGHCGSE